ncbi:hypothetical protein BKA70DRAFT_1556378 [Coprinopsis sp. MPI-PUGE-AT-0042]|nr:hypothetical protein BKA70DRAFT_1556378 [Coprinopsis sp. MPI-PUGE-AT-0042]
MHDDQIASYITTLTRAATSIREARYAMAAMYGLQLHELILSMGKEIRLIHRSRWTSVKLAYLLCRYYVLLLWPVILWSYLPAHSFELCQRSTKAINIVLAPCQVFPQAVMAMRAFAFSGRDKRALTVLGLSFTALVITEIWAWCLRVDLLPEVFYVVLRGTDLTGCFPNWGGPVMGVRIGISMLGAVLMDMISLVVVLFFCKKKSDTRGSSLGRYFVNQGLWAFVSVTVVNAVAAIMFFRPPSFSIGIGLPLALVVPNIVACRVILQLRRRVVPSDTEIERLHSYIVHRAFSSEAQDLWTMDDE